MFCKHCGNEISKSARFCESCGKPIFESSAPVEQQPDARRCPKCGEPVNRYAQICRFCGATISPQSSHSVSSKQTERKKKRPFGCLVWALLFLLILGSCSALFGGTFSDPVSDDTPTASTVGIVPPESETDSATISLDIVAFTAENILKEQFADCSISYDETGFTATITADGISLIGSLAATGNEEMKASWDEIVSNTVSMSNSMTQYFRDCGYNDYVVTLNVVNDENKDNIVIMTMNGVLVYDAVADK